MKPIKLLIISAIFGFFAIVGDQSAYQVEKKIYVLDDKIETLEEELDKNMNIFDFFSVNHKMVLYGLNHSFILKYLNTVQNKINSNMLNLTIKSPEDIKKNQNLLNSFQFFNNENKNVLDNNKFQKLILDESWTVLNLLDEMCLEYSNKKMCDGLKKLITDAKKNEIKYSEVNKIELNIYNIDFALAAIKYGQRDILKKKLTLISKVKSLTFWRQLSLVVSVAGSILSIIFILLYFRRYLISKI